MWTLEKRHLKRLPTATLSCCITIQKKGGMGWDKPLPKTKMTNLAWNSGCNTIYPCWHPSLGWESSGCSFETPVHLNTLWSLHEKVSLLLTIFIYGKIFSTFSISIFRPRGCIRIYIPIGQLVLTGLKSLFMTREWQIRIFLSNLYFLFTKAWLWPLAMYGVHRYKILQPCMQVNWPLFNIIITITSIIINILCITILITMIKITLNIIISIIKSQCNYHKSR